MEQVCGGKEQVEGTGVWRKETGTWKEKTRGGTGV